MIWFWVDLCRIVGLVSISATKWLGSSPQWDLNSRPLVYKTSALTPELWRHLKHLQRSSPIWSDFVLMILIFYRILLEDFFTKHIDEHGTAVARSAMSVCSVWWDVQHLKVGLEGGAWVQESNLASSEQMCTAATLIVHQISDKRCKLSSQYVIYIDMWSFILFMPAPVAQSVSAPYL